MKIHFLTREYLRINFKKMKKEILIKIYFENPFLLLKFTTSKIKKIYF